MASYQTGRGGRDNALQLSMPKAPESRFVHRLLSVTWSTCASMERFTSRACSEQAVPEAGSGSAPFVAEPYRVHAGNRDNSCVSGLIEQGCLCACHMLHLATSLTPVFPPEDCSARRVQAALGQPTFRSDVVLTSQRRRKQPICRARPQRELARGARPADPQEQELAEADFEAKQSLYAQLLDRQRSSQPSETSSSGKDQANDAPGLPVRAAQASTELIFRLERRGEGWGEEIFPHLVVEQRPLADVKKRDRNRSSRPRPWTVCVLLVLC